MNYIEANAFVTINNRRKNEKEIVEKKKWLNKRAFVARFDGKLNFNAKTMRKNILNTQR